MTQEMLAMLERLAPEDGPEIVYDCDRISMCPHCFGGWSNGLGTFRHTPDCAYVDARALIERVKLNSPSNPPATQPQPAPNWDRMGLGGLRE